MVPDLIDFLAYCFYNQNFKVKYLGAKKSAAVTANMGIKALDWVRSAANEAFEKSEHFEPAATSVSWPAWQGPLCPTEIRPARAGS